MSKDFIDTRISDIEVTEKGCHHNSNESEDCATVDSQNLVDRKSKPIKTKTRKDGAIAKLPVTLAEIKVQFLLHANIDLPESAIKIKDMKKYLQVTQCRLLQPTNVLFVKGFIRKHIDYATKGCSNDRSVCGDIRHCTMDVPFEFTTPIKYLDKPDKPILSKRRELEYLDDRCPNQESCPETDGSLSKDFCEYNQESLEFFNKKPFCDLIFSRIVEFDKYVDPTNSNDNNSSFPERTFTQIEERMVIELGLRILQKQQVSIPATHGSKPSKE
ncbi:MAG TPA: hypothetical protein VK087_02740 [Tissierellaceae bacterium]|nr:hypothetical protein [Tissierellaceae bacterium]